MTHCAKCGAELIGSRKFCAACGAPAGDPRSPAASTGLAPAASGRTPPAPPSTRGSTPSNPGSAPGSSPSAPGSAGSGPSIQYAPAPASLVNPFAQTAGPARSVRASDYGPPPASVPPELSTTTRGVGDPSSGPQVSPLAVSNVDSRRGAFENAVTAGPASAAAAAAGLFPPVMQNPLAATANDPAPAPSGAMRKPVAGTQMMPSMANPPVPSASPAGGTPASGGGPKSVPRPDRTQLLGAIPANAFARPPSAPEHAQSAPPQPPAPVPAPAQPAPHQPPQPQAPAWSPNPAPAQFIPTPQQPQHPLAVGGVYQQPPMPMPPQQPPSANYMFGYAPGSRVTVTWSNGQRYPGTVQQVSGSQCLVVFPDGQQHWVEMQYVAPA